MNKVIKYFIFSFLCILTVSCSTTEKFTVTGTPGTKIYTPNKQQLATIGDNGHAKVEVTSDAFYGYLLTHDDKKNEWVPFALETKKNKHTGTHFALYTAYPIAVIGLGAEIAGIVGASTGADDVAAIGCGGGAGLLGIGAVMGMISHGRLDQVSYQYNFGYQSNQKTNDDITLTKYQSPATISAANSQQSVASRPRGKANSQQNSATGAKADPQVSTTNHRVKRDYASQVEGTYSGKGVLKLNNVVDEQIDALIIKVTAVDKNNVEVVILEDNSPFFNSKELYEVTTNNNGEYVLTHKNIPAATINISKRGKMEYNHPAVMIESDKFTLSISATKK